MLDQREQLDHVVTSPQSEQLAMPAITGVLSAVATPDTEIRPLIPSGPIPTPTAQRTGRWTPEEKILFLYGLKRFGKGRWKKMSIYLPHR